MRYFSACESLGFVDLIFTEMSQWLHTEFLCIDCTAEHIAVNSFCSLFG